MPQKHDTPNLINRSAEETASAPVRDPIAIPKGGGAAKGISETFKANPVTGTSSLGLPLPISPARGFQPELSLSYDSGSGNGVFGLGWNVGIPSIRRKTEKGLPRYRDAEDSDIYMLGGAEDLVPLLMENGDNWEPQIFTKSFGGISWEVKYYRPRIEGGFAKIERWRDPESGRIWWRVMGGDNTTSVYGFREEACISDPNSPAKVFSWLLDCRFDDKGHYLQYDYKAEDLDRVDFGLSYEAHRIRAGAPSQRYLKRVLYGIKDSWIKQGLSVEQLIETKFSPDQFHFQTVFDYGDHEGEFPVAEETKTDVWDAREDPFSDYRAGFEIRTWRICKRVLLFHKFGDELATPSELVRSLNISYNEGSAGVRLLTSVVSTGYKRDRDGVMTSQSLPALSLRYQEHVWNTELKTLNKEAAGELPMGLNGRQYQWVDLYGEGLSGVLSEREGALAYMKNLGDGNFSKTEILSPSPSLSGLSGGALQIRDIEGNGQKQLVVPVLNGYFPLNREGQWESFRSFETMPNIDPNDPNVRFLDITGDGKADLLISEENVFRWYPATGSKGYEEAQTTAKSQNEADGPAVIFANESESIFLADMSGDGLSDIVRIRNGNIVYWPNIGYGKFGSRVTMAESPWFDHPDQFDPGRIQLADLDGSGPTDLFYLGKGEFRYWLNFDGNRWSTAEKVINPFPEVDPLRNVSVVDFLGEGTACIVWSSQAPGDAGRPLKYINLMAGKKPYLMMGFENGMGKEVSLSYKPSTHFYLEDKAKGEPWVTRLHFPVHCLEKVETIDHISGTRFASSYSYHHGYYDMFEREFRGFGRVDQLDTEEFEHFSAGGSSNALENVFHQPPVLVKTWFHNGAALDRRKIQTRYENEYFPRKEEDEPDPLKGFRMAEPSLPDGLSDEEWRESLRACKGLALRVETYGLDGTLLDGVPYTIAEKSARILQVQPMAGQRHAVYQVIASESVSLQLDRNVDDPRISHQCVLATNPYGQPTVTAVIGYGRQIVDSALPTEVRDAQARHHVVVSSVETTRDEYGLLGDFDLGGSLDDVYRLPGAYRNRTYEFHCDAPASGTLLSPTRLATFFQSATDLAYEDQSRASNTRRLLSESEAYFANETLDGPIVAGEMGRLGIPWQSYQLAFTPGLIEHIYEGRVDPASFEGGYVDLHDDGNWWVPSGTTIWGEDAAENFFAAKGSRDAVGNESWADMDPYWILPFRTRDAKQNESFAINDYRILGPVFQRDANHNWGGVEVDALGQVVATAAMGKIPGLPPEGTPTTDAVCEGDNLENPSAIFEYDYHCWERERKPVWTKSTAWEDHHFVNPNREKTQIAYEYADGSGNTLLAKAQAKPGLAKRRNAEGIVEEVDTGDQLRWIGNGRTVLNNKGNPVKQYEPYFSVTHEYEDAEELVGTGISPILFYDAVGRNECSLNPNHTYTKAVSSPWEMSAWDVNDTLYLDEDDTKEPDPRFDPDVGHYFEAIEETDFLPTWYQARIDGALGAEQQRAAQITEKHVATPARTFTDSLGRTIYGLVDNGEQGLYKTLTHNDIEGNLIAVIDDRDNPVMSYRYHLLPPPDEKSPKPSLYEKSMDGGERRGLMNVLGQPLKSWDSRGHIISIEYDELNRQTKSWLDSGGEKILIGASEYHDADKADAPSLRAKNLLGAVYRSFDQSGKKETHEIDFKGGLLRASQTLALDYKGTINWNVPDRATLLENETFESSSEYDALGRVTKALAPHNANIPASESRPTYHESNALDKMFVSIRGGAEALYVEEIEYDAKGQRKSVVYGNGVSTIYDYEQDTYRLTRLLSRRGSEVLQDLNYIYDPVGNITDIRDHSQQTIYFNSTVVEPHNTYEYDALYRLTYATGREHSTQAAFPHPEAGFAPEPHKGDGQAMRNYAQSYVYDSVGNIMEMAHRPSNASSGWTRRYQYEDSNNRLAATEVGNPAQPFDQRYGYNEHGSMISMPHLPLMDWDFTEMLRHVDLQGGGDAYYVYDSGGQRIRKVIESNGSLVKERIYLGGWEIYRERNASGLQLERESLHVMDDSKRIALIETKTVDTGSTSGFTPVVRYQMSNHLGSASLELNDEGEIISYEEFHPYGTTSYHAAKTGLEISAKRYRYTGKERDEETGFSYHSARYLAPWLGRWTTADPIGIGDGVNVYLYCRGNPAGSLDSTGCGTENAKLTLTNNVHGVNLEEELPGVIETLKSGGYDYGSAHRIKDTSGRPVLIHLSKEGRFSAQWLQPENPYSYTSIQIRLGAIDLAKDFNREIESRVRTRDISPIDAKMEIRSETNAAVDKVWEYIIFNLPFEALAGQINKIASKIENNSSRWTPTASPSSSRQAPSLPASKPPAKAAEQAPSAPRLNPADLTSTQLGELSDAAALNVARTDPRFGGVIGDQVKWTMRPGGRGPIYDGRTDALAQSGPDGRPAILDGKFGIDPPTTDAQTFGYPAMQAGEPVFFGVHGKRTGLPPTMIGTPFNGSQGVDVWFVSNAPGNVLLPPVVWQSRGNTLRILMPLGN